MSSSQPTPRRDTLAGYIQPVIERLLRRHARTPQEHIRLRAALDHRLAALLAAYDPASAVPLLPYLSRHLSACIYAFAQCAARGEAPLFSAEEAVVDEEEGPPSSTPAGMPERIMELPGYHRDVVRGYYYEGRSCAALAALLDETPETVRTLLCEGFRMLREAPAQETSAREEALVRAVRSAAAARKEL
jgi:DNA-directed RNA polymerase specialized sigma24 family protein